MNAPSSREVQAASADRAFIATRLPSAIGILCKNGVDAYYFYGDGGEYVWSYSRAAIIREFYAR